MMANNSPNPDCSQPAAVIQLAPPLAKYNHKNSTLNISNQHLYAMEDGL